MAIAPTDSVLQEFDECFLILDFNHLFIASTLHEEMWLLQTRDDRDLIAKIIQDAEEFHIYGVQEDREIDTYSGGEQAILGCLLIIALIKGKQVYNIHILLYNVLGSISSANRTILLQKFPTLWLHNQIKLYTNEGSFLKEISFPYEDNEG